MADPAVAPGTTEEDVDYSIHEQAAVEDESGSAEQLEELQQMLSEMEESQAKIAEASNQASSQATTALAAKAKIEEQKQQRDERSVFVQNVDFKTTGEELMAFFQPCGSVERVTILADKFGHPKGCVIWSSGYPHSPPLRLKLNRPPLPLSFLLPGAASHMSSSMTRLRLKTPSFSRAPPSRTAHSKFSASARTCPASSCVAGVAVEGREGEGATCLVAAALLPEAGAVGATTAAGVAGPSAAGAEGAEATNSY
jgi:polyadenylate-binding protein 2